MDPILRTQVAVVAVGVGISSLVACASAPGPSASPAGPPIVATTEQADLRLTMTLEGPPASGTRTWADGLVENRSDRAARWSGLCDVPISFVIDLRSAFVEGRTWPGRSGRFKAEALGAGGQNPASGSYIEASHIPPPGQISACPASLGVRQLLPGASLTVRSAWDGTMGGVAPAPAGPAKVTASFGFMGFRGQVPDSSTDVRPIEVTVETVVQPGPGPTPLSPSVAVDAALADPAFSQWVEGTDDPAWMGPNVTYLDGLWWIGLFRHGSAGADDSYGEVRVDRSGAIVARRFGPMS